MIKTRIILVAIVLTFAFKVFSQESLELPEYIKHEKLSKEQLISVNLSGRIAGAKNTINFRGAMGQDVGKPYFTKTIKVAADGSFKVKLTLPKKGDRGYYQLLKFSKQWMVILYLRDGYNLTVNTSIKDTRNGKSPKFTGKGAVQNRFLQDNYHIIPFEGKDPLALDKKTFDRKLQAWKNSADSLYVAYKDMGIDSFIAQRKEEDKSQLGWLPDYYAKHHYLINHKLEGKPSPKFLNYENFKGGTTSLDDFKGKYVYIDLWATWCAPCKYQIPFLKKIEEKYYGKNIAFVSISVDKKAQYNNWRKMISNKEMGGIQLIADNDFKSKFVRDYKINSIPRFILIDPKGNVVKSAAPRPSDPKLKALFKKLGI